MTAVLLDTHAWAWSLAGDDRLSKPALAAIEAADTVLVSPITFFEIAQKVRLGKCQRRMKFGPSAFSVQRVSFAGESGRDNITPPRGRDGAAGQIRHDRTSCA